MSILLLLFIYALRKFHNYLYGQEILLRTDNSAVSYALSLKNPTGQELGTYNLKFMHRPGTHHRNADALSRIPCAACERIEKSEQKWKSEQQDEEESL